MTDNDLMEGLDALIPECKECPHSVGDHYERDCAFPDCMGGDVSVPIETIIALRARLESQDSLLAEQLLRINALYDGTESTPALVKIVRLEAEVESQQEEIELLKSGMTGDYDLDAWLEWAKEAKKLREKVALLTKEPA